MQKQNFRLYKRPMILVEILIALALITLCFLPLIAPHVALYKQQSKLTQIMELDRTVQLLYADILERLHKNDIPWSVIVERREMPIDKALLEQLNAGKSTPWNGSYKFVERKRKGSDQTGWWVSMVDLTFTFAHKDELQLAKESGIEAKRLTFPYSLIITRKLPPIEDVEQNTEVAPEPTDKKKLERKSNKEKAK